MAEKSPVRFRRWLADRLVRLALMARGWQPVAGASDPPADPPADPPPAADPPADPPADDGPGDPPAPDASLDEWKTHTRKHEARSKENLEQARKAQADLAKEAKERAALEKKLKEYQDRDLSDQERAIAQAREEAATTTRTEVTTAYQQRILKAEVRAHATGKFANPALALKLLDLGDDVFDDDGEINGAAIDTAIDKVLTAEPYLKAGAASHGSAETGRGEGGGAKDLEDLSADEHFKRIQAR